MEMTGRVPDQKKLAALGQITAMMRDAALADLRRACATEEKARQTIASLRPMPLLGDGMDAATHARLEAARLVRLGEANMALARAQSEVERARRVASKALGRDSALSKLAAATRR
jgi:hypothetical protein